ncbi:hypothetical protein COLO4_27574 [Corchorus olitorius]|uniref:RING-type E3 ubiquitin transferase n=1 Tax=Corchorus olitorius TaxID=93759 RepID=A0A1R3HQJ4_9ROSI|nr:hypothetical protein COLO4_27574 [Corchorus olitorius]
MKILSALFCLLIFLFILVTQARNNPQQCSSSCGDIPNISYPFRLKEDPAGCGDPDFELSCKNNSTILNFHGGKYYVKKISYDQHIIRVVDVNLANGSCGLPSKAMSMDQLTMSRVYPGTVDFSSSYTLNYVRCSSNISNLGNSRVPCLSNNSSNVYVNISSWWSLAYDQIPKSCKLISSVPATYEEDMDLLHQQNVSYETILKMQESGFDMVWSVECRDCSVKGRYCETKSNSTTLFKCKKEYDYNLVLLAVYSFLIAEYLAGNFLVLFSSFKFQLFSLPNPAGCGDRDYELSCLENNSTILDFRKGFYYVKKISYDKHIIQVVDVNFANGSCGLPSRALSLDQLLVDPRYPGVTNYNYTYTLYYLRCSSEISELANSRVPCLSEDSSNVYVKVTSYWRRLFTFIDFPSSCKLISTLPSYYYDVKNVEQKKPSYGTILKMQESGFDMVWSVECRDCKSKPRSSCYQRDNSTTEFDCFTISYDDGSFIYLPV